MSLQGAGNPQTVDVKPAACFNGHPCVFRRNIFDKALSALLAAIKDKSLIKSLLQPLFFCKSLLAGHGTADVLLVDVLFCDMDIFHRSSPDFLHIYCMISGSKASDFDACIIICLSSITAVRKALTFLFSGRLLQTVQRLPDSFHRQNIPPDPYKYR